MGTFRCNECERFSHSHDGGCVSPKDDTEFICVECELLYECEYCGEQTEDIDTMHPECKKALAGDIKYQQNKDERAEANYGTARN